MRGRVQDLLVLGLAGVALASAVSLQVARDRWYPRERRAEENILYIPSGEVLRRLTLGFDALAADIYWIRAIQHYGGDRLARDRPGEKYKLLYPLLDLTTTLDPHFNIAYRFGAIFLGEPPPGGPGRSDQSVALLRKALVAMPHKWHYYHDIAFVYYWRLHDYTAAAQWFQMAGQQPDAPNWLAPLAASMLTRGQDRASARFLWQQLRSSEEPWLRRSAEHALRQIQALDQIDQLEAAVRRFPPPPGEPYSWAVLIRKGVLNRMPLDPTLTPYELDPQTGRVTVSRQSPLSPMPDETRPLQ